MPPLPKPLVGHLARRSLQEQGAAWFRVDPKGRVTSCGGNLEAYGLSSLRRGRSVGPHAPFLAGLGAETGRYELIPRVQLAPGRFADVHVVPHDAARWVLLLDTTEQAHLETAKQQHWYDLALALEQSRKRDLADVVQALEVLVLRRAESGRFDVLGDTPSWASPWVRGDRSVRPVDAWPFLEDYLREAEAYWADRSLTSRRWGPWTEKAADGSDVHLEALVSRSERHGPLLLVERLGEHEREKQSLIQRVRERHLEHDKKDVLLHCIVHDLNNPLTAIMGCLGLLAGGVGSMEQVKALAETALRQARRQARLIHDIMDVFAADVGALRTEGKDDTVDVASCARDVTEEYAPAFSRKGLEYRLEIATEDGESLARGAPAGLFRVFGNLLENALRHTRSGGAVVVRLSRRDADVDVRVENDGRPVPEELRPRLFDKFTRSAEGGGLAGLGLFYCRMALRRWGGDIEYEARDEGGSCFRFRLPAAG